MKRIFLYFYDKQNLGDDLFVRMICKRYPEVQFYAWHSTKENEGFRDLKNLFVLDQNSLKVRLLKKIRRSLVAHYRDWMENRCNAVVYIGGSIFIEYESWEQILTWWEYEAKNRSLYVLGANFGPYQTEAYRDKFADIFSFSKDICFRDKYSQQMFSENPSVRWAPDILFGQQMPPRRRKDKRILFAVIDCASKSEGINQIRNFEEPYLSLICDMVQKSWQLGYNPVLASFCEYEGDKKAVEKIKKKIAPEVLKNTETVYYTGSNTMEMLQAISDSDYIVATRFHATILGFAAEKPVLPIVYSDKMLHVLKDVGFKGAVLDLRHLENADDAYVRMMKKTHCQELEGVARFSKRAESHFAKLDEIVRK